MVAALLRSCKERLRRPTQNLEAKLDALHSKLEKAKYKAEAGLNVRRGFVTADSGIGGLTRKGSWGKRARREEKEDLLHWKDDRWTSSRNRGPDGYEYNPPNVDKDGEIDDDEGGYS